MFYFFQIFFLLIIFFLVLNKMKSNKIKICFAIFFSLYFTLQMASVYLIGGFINYQFYYHSGIDEIKTYIFQFTMEYTIFSLLFIFMFFLFVLVNIRDFIKKINIKLLFFSIAICFSFLCVSDGIINENIQLIKMLTHNKKTFTEALNSIGITSEKYITKEMLKATKGKNIIVISLESLEKGFLGDDFNQLTPNLNQFSKDYTFFDNFFVSEGGTWTSGSMYSVMTGVPALFNGFANDFFQGASASKIVSLGHVLNKAGYVSKYIVGKPEFSGMKELLKINKFKVISEENCLGKYPETRVGLNDIDVFTEAKLQIEESLKKNENFALFMSTINTHFPNGVEDKRMEGKLKSRNPYLEYAVSCSDYLLGDFINYLKKINILDNTVFFIFPDHPLMGSGSIINKLEKSQRAMYLITNGNKGLFFKKENERIYQIDLPRLIIQGAEISSNGLFLCDFLKKQNVDSFISEQFEALTILNSSSLVRDIIKEKMVITFKDNQLLIKSAAMKIVEEKKINFTEKNTYLITLNKDFTLLRKDSGSLNKCLYIIKSNEERGKKYIYLFLNFSSNPWTAYLGNFKNVGLIQTSIKNKVTFTKEDIQKIKESVNQSLKFDNVNQTDSKKKNRNENIPNVKSDSGRLIAHAGGKIKGKTYTNSLEALNNSYKEGFRMFELDIIKTEDNQFVASHDWEHWKKITGNVNNRYPIPTRAEFKRYKIYGEFTPLDMNDINHWFTEHKDAVLVTDKINSPKEFSDQFVDKNRLMMELFSWSKIDEALSCGIMGVMPTGNLVLELKSDKIDFLKKKNIKYVALCRNKITGNETLLKDLKSAGIKLFAFCINSKDGKNEEYVLTHEMDYFYGIYADEWHF